MEETRNQCGEFWAPGVDIKELWEKYLLAII